MALNCGYLGYIRGWLGGLGSGHKECINRERQLVQGLPLPTAALAQRFFGPLMNWGLPVVLNLILLQEPRKKQVNQFSYKTRKTQKVQFSTFGQVTFPILIVPCPHPSGRPFRKVSLRSRVGSGTMLPNTREHGRSIRVYAAMPLRMLERTDPSRNPAKRPRCTKPRRLARLNSSARASESSEEPAPYIFTQDSDARDCNSPPLPVPLTNQNMDNMTSHLTS